MINIKNIFNNKIKEKGAATMILVFFFMFISITILIGIVTPVVREFKIASNMLSSRQSYFVSESGVEDAMYRIKNGKQISATENMVLGDSIATTSITSVTANKKEISSIGDDGSLQRKNKISLTTAPGASFSYGLQVGQGGLDLSNSTEISGGDIYVNGNIIAQNAKVHGNVYVASPVPAPVHVSNIGANTPSSYVSLGYTPKEDFAQSFTPTENGVLKRVSIYMKTVQSASNFSISVVNDNGTGPGTTTLATWTSPNNSFGTMGDYGWINADFSTTPNVYANTKYWIVFNHATSQWNHHLLALTTGGDAKVRASDGSSWITNSPASSGYYKVYLNNIPSYIKGESYGSLDIEGNIYADMVNGVKIDSNYNMYCQSGYNNKSCITTPESSSNPPPIGFPISSDSIDSWKAQATSGGVTNGTVTVNGSDLSMGPRKIIGDLIVANKTLTLTGTIYVTGKIQVSNGGDIKLASSFGSNDGMILSDGPIYVYGGSEISGSGNSNSFLVAVTTNNTIHTGSPTAKEQFAGYLDNSGAVDALYAPNGDVWLAGGTDANAVSAYKMTLSNGSKVEFKSALTNMTFQSSSASGGWSLSSWQESQ